MPSKRWKQIVRKGPEEWYPHLLDESDDCHHVEDYLRGQGYDPVGNQVVLNLKIHPSDTRRIVHKKRAAQTFATYLSSVQGGHWSRCDPTSGSYRYSNADGR